MEELVLADQNVALCLRQMANSLEPASSTTLKADQKLNVQHFQFSAAEESAVERKLTDLMELLAQRCDEWREKWLDRKPTDADLEANHRQWQQIDQKQATYKLQMRQLLVKYRQRAKAERLARQRSALLPSAPSTTNDATHTGKSLAAQTNNSSAMDVTASLRRTKQVMSQEIQRVSSVTKVLDDGTQSLQSSHQEYDSVNAELAQVRKRLAALQWQAYKDKLWISAGIVIFLATALNIIYQRTGIPLLF